MILFSQPWKTGGAETHVETLIKGLNEHKVFLAVNEGSQIDKLEKLQVSYPHLQVFTIQTRGTNILRWRRDWLRLQALVQTEQIEVIAAQQRTAGIWAYFLHRNNRIPFTVTMHDPWHRAKFKTMYSRIFPRILVVNHNLAEKLRTEFTFTTEQITVIDNGIDFDAFAPQPQEKVRATLGLPKKGKLLLHVSRLSRIKGGVALQLITAMDKLMRRGIVDRLIIIGEGPLYKELEERIEKLNACRGVHIELRDFTDRIALWYNAADLLVGEGRVAIEALACYRPVVAIRNAEHFIGAITTANIVYACDVNFDGHDFPATPEKLADEVEKAAALSSTERAAIADYIRQRLSVRNMVESYLTAFGEMIS